MSISKTIERGINRVGFGIGTALSPVLHSRDLSNRLRHGAGAPKRLQTLYINPADAVFMLHGKVPGTPKFGRDDSGRIIGGDWEKTKVRIDSFPKAQYLYRHFEEGLSWEEAGAYTFMRDAIETYGQCDGIRTEDGMFKRYAGLEQAFQDMRSSGQLKTRKQLKGGSLREKGGIVIHVGANGMPIFGGGGTHRLVMSQILALPRIPTQLGIVHEDAVKSGAFSALKQRVSQKPQR